MNTRFRQVRLAPRRAALAAGTGMVVGILIFGAYVYAYHEPLASYAWDAWKADRIASALMPRDAGLYLLMGDHHFGRGGYDLRRAKAYYERALALDPAIPRAHFELARIYFIQGEFPKALAETDTERALHPDNRRVHYLRGLIYGYADSLPAAAEEFKAFLAWKPSSWAAHNDIAWIYFRLGDFAAVERHARAGLEHAPGNPWLQNTLGTALLNLGRYEEAEEYLRSAQAGFAAMVPEDWGRAYPGNDPRVYEEGLAASRISVEENLALVTRRATGADPPAP